MTSVLIILIAVFTDTLLGEPKKWHPLAGFGKLASRVESVLFNIRINDTPRAMNILGSIAWLVTVIPFVVLVYYLASVNAVMYWVVSIVAVYLCIGNYSLAQHAQAVMTALESNDMEHARIRIAFMVSRDTQQMSPDDIASATVESVLENGCDAIFGAIFWFLILGAPGVVLYRLSNTLDAMWGYKNTRYRYFGWASARIDDVLNWLPAQLTSLSYSLMGNVFNAFKAWFTQARFWKSINAGSVMASGAGALNLQLGGTASYAGTVQQRPVLGYGVKPAAKDIKRSVRLVQRSLWLWLIIIFTGGVLVHGTWW